MLFISYALSAETYLDEKFTAKYDLKKSKITFGRNVNKLEKIAKENHEVSNIVFEAIKSENDIDNMMLYFKGEYEKS